MLKMRTNQFLNLSVLFKFSGIVVLYRAKKIAHNEDWSSFLPDKWWHMGHEWIDTEEAFQYYYEGSREQKEILVSRWQHREKPFLTLVHFIGDKRLSVDQPHGKSKKQDTIYNRTAPSLIRELEVGTKKPFDEYQNHAFNAPADIGTQNLRVPRNITQVCNAQQRFKKMKKGTDSFSNLNRISLENEDVRFLMTVTDLFMVNMTPEIVKQAREILRIDYDKAAQMNLLGYDTQFQLGDYYVSWISIRDIRFKDKKSNKSPVIPMAHIMHKRNVQLHHKMA